MRKYVDHADKFISQDYRYSPSDSFVSVTEIILFIYFKILLNYFIFKLQYFDNDYNKSIHTSKNLIYFMIKSNNK